MLAQAIKRHGVRGTARALGVTPAYISMISTGKKPLTATIEGRLTELVNTPSVNSAPGTTNGKQRTTALVGDRGLEPRTPVLSGLCSDRLS